MRIYYRYQTIIDDYNDFIDALRRPLRTTIRINTLKAKKEMVLNMLADLEPEPLPYYEYGYRIEGDRIGNRVEHFLGLIYVQEATSLLPPLIMDLKPGLKVLDLCAAPGSKTTQIAQHMENTGLIVANDNSWERIRGLANNLDRAGVVNTVITRYDGKVIAKKITDYFDRVLVDAPCSAEGTIRQSRMVLYHWGLKNIERLSRLQIGLLISGFKALKKGGILIYSTCTFAPEENERVVSYLLKRFPAARIEPIRISGLKTRPGILSWQRERFNDEVVKTVRIYPQDNDTGGFYLARIRKVGDVA